MVHNHYNGYLDFLFHWQKVFPLRESASIMSGNGKDSHLRNYLEVHSLSSDQVFLSIQVKNFFKVWWMDFLTCFCF